MVELWIPITIVAAFMQNARSALQKHLKGRLSTLGATYVRFLYAWPFALLYLLALDHWGGMEMPDFNGIFLLYCVLGGVSQIVFGRFLVQRAQAGIRAGAFQAVIYFPPGFGQKLTMFRDQLSERVEDTEDRLEVLSGEIQAAEKVISDRDEAESWLRENKEELLLQLERLWRKDLKVYPEMNLKMILVTNPPLRHQKPVASFLTTFKIQLPTFFSMPLTKVC